MYRMIHLSPHTSVGGLKLNKKTNMKNERLTYTLLGGTVVALAWLLSGVREPINADSLLAYVAVLATFAIGTVDYRLTAKRALAR